MLGNGFQYDFRHVWKCSDFDQLMELGPLFIAEQLQTIQEIPKAFHGTFANTRISKHEMSEKVCAEHC